MSKSGKSRRRIRSACIQELDSIEKDSPRDQNFRKVFRGAQMAGLFPVTGLKSNPDSAVNENIEFRPVSFRLVATVVFIFAVIFLEGLGLLHMLLFSQDKNGNAHGNHVMNSNFAPVLHYGTTVASVILLLNMARRFPKTAELWENAETLISEYPIITNSKCTIIGLVLIIIIMATLQSIFGTIGTAVITESNNGTLTVFEAFHDFMSNYRMGSHGFVSSIMDDTLWSGLAIFLVSNYTIIVWIIVDLILILATRNINQMAMILNIELRKCLKTESSLQKIRMDHWTLCSLTYNLNSSLNGILLAFYIGNLYFLWSHLMSVTWPPIYSSLYLLYQSWALIRQWIRFCLVTYYATKTSSTLVWPLRQAMGLENSVEAKKIQDQASLVYNGFTVGPFIPLNEKSVTLAIILFIFAYWMSLLMYDTTNDVSIDTFQIGQEISTVRPENMHRVVSVQRPIRFQKVDLNIVMW